jgi:hypothetical protein
MAEFSKKFALATLLFIFFLVLVILAGNLYQNKAALTMYYQREVSGILVMSVVGSIVAIFLIYIQYSGDNNTENALTRSTKSLLGL